MVLHVEHLLEFVNFGAVAMKHGSAEAIQWLRHALLAWRKALTQTLAI